MSVAAALSRTTSRIDLLLVAGALPALILSLTAALCCTHRGSGTDGEEMTTSLPPPISSIRRPRLVRTGIVAVASAGACVMSVWLTVRVCSVRERFLFAAGMLFMAGIGGLAGRFRRRVTSESIWGFGIACLSAGSLVALGVIWPPTETSDRGLARLICTFAAMLSIGAATTYGRKALLDRVASRSNTGAAILARTLVYVGLTVWILAPTAQRLIGQQATLLIPSLLLAAIGVSLMVREPILSENTTQ